MNTFKLLLVTLFLLTPLSSFGKWWQNGILQDPIIAATNSLDTALKAGRLVGDIANTNHVITATNSTILYVDGIRSNITTGTALSLTTAMHRWTFVVQTSAKYTFTLPSVDGNDKQLIYYFEDWQLTDAGTTVVKTADSDILSNTTNASIYSSVMKSGSAARVSLSAADKWTFWTLDGTWTPNYLD